MGRRLGLKQDPPVSSSAWIPLSEATNPQGFLQLCRPISCSSRLPPPHSPDTPSTTGVLWEGLDASFPGAHSRRFLSLPL